MRGMRGMHFSIESCAQPQLKPQPQLKCIPCAAPPLSRVELEELPVKNFRGPCAARCKPLAPCCCVSADGEAIFGCVPTKRSYFLPACLHMALCPQLGCDPKGGFENDDREDLFYCSLVSTLFVCCFQAPITNHQLPIAFKMFLWRRNW